MVRFLSFLFLCLFFFPQDALGIQLVRPDGNTGSSGTWRSQTGGPASFTAIDEVTAVDTDYIQNNGSAPGNYYEVSLSNSLTPLTSGSYIIRWRALRTASTKTITASVQLRQGATIIATQTQTITTTATTFSYTLTPAEMAAITDTTNLRLRFTMVSRTGGGGNPNTRFTWAELETPHQIGLSTDIVNGSGVSIAAPLVVFDEQNFDWNISSSTGVLGSTTEKIHLANNSSAPIWTLSIAATDGPTALWTNGTDTYDFNGSSATGRLQIDPSIATIAPQGGCAITGLSKGVSTWFSQGVTDEITLLSSGATAQTGCYWDVTGIGLTQDVPASQPSGIYTLSLTLTAA